MTSLENLFRGPSSSTSSSTKRKPERGRDPNEIYKSIKRTGTADVRNSASVAVESPKGVDNEDEDAVAGPEMPPDEEEADDEEGRFFGGGITKDTAEVLDFVNDQDETGLKPEIIDLAWLRKTALNFEKRISKNAELRAKFEGQPEKFMASEADLDADIKALSILSSHPELYAEFARLGCIASLLSLLAHENVDIAIGAVEIVAELTDEDVEATSEQWDGLVNTLLEADILDLLAQNLCRLDESVEADRAGVYHILSTVENLTSAPKPATQIALHASLLPWLLARAQNPPPPSSITQNQQYAIELIAILSQTAPQITVPCLLVANAVDAFLRLLAPFRKRDPAKGTEEPEFVQNVFDSLTCVVDLKEGKESFVQAEGVELAVLLLKSEAIVRGGAVRLLDHAVGGRGGEEAAERLVEGGGLGRLFGVLMKKQDRTTTEHLIGLLALLLRTLPGDSAPRIRLLGKFVERDYEKIARLVMLRRGYASRVDDADMIIAQERREQSEITEDRESAWLSARLDAGLFALQSIDVILAWLVAEDDGAKGEVKKLLADRDEGLPDLRKTLQEQLDGMAESAQEEDPELKDMLGTLLAFLI